MMHSQESSHGFHSQHTSNFVAVPAHHAKHQSGTSIKIITSHDLGSDASQMTFIPKRTQQMMQTQAAFMQPGIVEETESQLNNEDMADLNVTDLQPMMRASRRYENEPQTAQKSLSQRNFVINTEHDSMMSDFESPGPLLLDQQPEKNRRDRFSHQISEQGKHFAEFRLPDDGTHSQDASFRQYNS